MMFNLLDSHDTERFLTQAGGDKRLEALALAVMFFFPGMPMVYYGDESGMEAAMTRTAAAASAGSARAGTCDSTGIVKKLAALKKQPCLSRGGCRVSESGGVAAIERFFGEQSVTLYLNPSDEARTCPAGPP
mgnify:CR=1 FL=1